MSLIALAKRFVRSKISGHGPERDKEKFEKEKDTTDESKSSEEPAKDAKKISPQDCKPF